MTKHHKAAKRQDANVRFHPALKNELATWASLLDLTAEKLLTLTKEAFMNREPESFNHPANPNMYQFSLSSFYIYFSVEDGEYLVRGYGWDTPEELVDDLEGGWFYGDPPRVNPK